MFLLNKFPSNSIQINEETTLPLVNRVTECATKDIENTIFLQTVLASLFPEDGGAAYLSHPAVVVRPPRSSKNGHAASTQASGLCTTVA